VVPKVLDFGLSTANDRHAQTRITADGQVLGTPMYMSPEQASGRQDLSPASDVWSMGVILYEALAGKLPFHGFTVAAVLDAIVTDDPAPIPSEVDPRTRAVVGRCLQKDPARRYPDASALRADLERALEACLRRKAAIAADEAPPSDAIETRSLTDPRRIAAEPPTTRPSRLQRHAHRKAGSPVILALVAAAMCAAAISAVPRRHGASVRANVGVARLARERAASLPPPAR
jgi:serine/threonine-protein kinase